MMPSSNPPLEKPSMSPVEIPSLETPSLETPPSETSYGDRVMGAAIFDLNGLPKDYLTSQESQDLSWVQMVFQALGLQSLLVSSLRLEGLRHVVVHGLDFQAIVVRQETCYIALLLRNVTLYLDPQFIQWARKLEPASLRQSSRLQPH